MLLFSDNIPVIKIKVQPQYLKIWLHLQNNYQIILYTIIIIQYVYSISPTSKPYPQSFASIPVTWNLQPPPTRSELLLLQSLDNTLKGLPCEQLLTKLMEPSRNLPPPFHLP